MILWWCLYFSTTADTGFMQRSVFRMEFSFGIFKFWTTLVKYSLNVSVISVSELRIYPFSVRFIISLAVILSEKRGLTNFRILLLSDMSFGFKFEKYYFLAFLKRVAGKLRFFLWALWEASFLPLKKSLHNIKVIFKQRIFQVLY